MNDKRAVTFLGRRGEGGSQKERGEGKATSRPLPVVSGPSGASASNGTRSREPANVWDLRTIREFCFKGRADDGPGVIGSGGRARDEGGEGREEEEREMKRKE